MKKSIPKWRTELPKNDSIGVPERTVEIVSPKKNNMLVPQNSFKEGSAILLF